MKTEIMNALGAFKSVSNYDGKPNQFLVEFENGEIFQSYDSIIVIEFNYNGDNQHSGKTYFGNDWNYSKTTSKYRNMFLGMDTKMCKDQIKNEQILVLDI